VCRTLNNAVKPDSVTIWISEDLHRHNSVREVRLLSLSPAIECFDYSVLRPSVLVDQTWPAGSYSADRLGRALLYQQIMLPNQIHRLHLAAVPSAAHNRLLQSQPGSVGRRLVISDKSVPRFTRRRIASGGVLIRPWRQ
jgi:hypothetical protein